MKKLLIAVITDAICLAWNILIGWFIYRDIQRGEFAWAMAFGFVCVMYRLDKIALKQSRLEDILR